MGMGKNEKIRNAKYPCISSPTVNNVAFSHDKLLWISGKDFTRQSILWRDFVSTVRLNMPLSSGSAGGTFVKSVSVTTLRTSIEFLGEKPPRP